jgi:hypothetical protein
MKLERTAVVSIVCNLCRIEVVGVAQPELWLPTVGDEVRVLSGPAYGRKGLISKITNGPDPIQVSLPDPYVYGNFKAGDLVKLPDMIARASLIAEARAIADGWKKRLNLWICGTCETIVMVTN